MRAEASVVVMCVSPFPLRALAEIQDIIYEYSQKLWESCLKDKYTDPPLFGMDVKFGLDALQNSPEGIHLLIPRPILFLRNVFVFYTMDTTQYVD